MSRRLGMYCVGVAIGLFLVAFLLSLRQVLVVPAAGNGAPAPAGGE